MTYTSSAVDNCFYCSLPLGGRFTYHWSNRCHFECVPKDEKDIRIIALSSQLEATKQRIAELEAAGDVMAKALRGNYIVPGSAKAWEDAKAKGATP